MKINIKEQTKKLLPLKFKHPYDRFNNDELIIRDYLAIQRTNLANERTLLSYINASIGLLVVGVSFVKFLDSLFLEMSGIIFIVAAVVTYFIGSINYYRRKKQIPHIEEMYGKDEIEKSAQM